MFEGYDFDTLIGRMLENVSDEFDKREGSVIYDALAPAALELENFYIALDMVADEVFAESASYYYLIKRAAERGLTPKEETYAIGKMVVTPASTVINAGERFNLDTLNYTVLSAIEGQQGAYEIQCETAGVEGNQQVGTLLPIEYIEGLETAVLTEILIPGEDEEDVETFRERYFTSFDDEAFGGNKTDYINKVNDIGGVGGCKVIRSWQRGYSPQKMIPSQEVVDWINQQSVETLGANVYDWIQTIYTAAADKLLTTGGTVKIIVITSEFKSPSATLIDAVQEILDPVNEPGEGDGVVPIGHVVNVVGVKSVIVDSEFSITYKDGYSFSTLKSSIEDALEAYYLELRQSWANDDYLIVRISQIESQLLELEGIADISNTKLNGKSENLVLDGESIPVRGDVIG